jgi:hypothetical protein
MELGKSVVESLALFGDGTTFGDADFKQFLDVCHVFIPLLTPPMLFQSN